MKQRRRVHTGDQAGGAGTQLDVIGTVDEGPAVNIHGFRMVFTTEPETADANANGTWAVWCLPRQSTAIPGQGLASLETEADNPALWAVGLWASSNQTPSTTEVSLGTSRNCQAGTRIVLRIRREGVSADNVDINAIMTWFQTTL